VVTEVKTATRHVAQNTMTAYAIYRNVHDFMNMTRETYNVKTDRPISTCMQLYKSAQTRSVSNG